MIKIAVVGGGTAGFIAAAHFTKQFPDVVDLYHIYDPNIPTIGVGEGTTPALRVWLHQTLGLPEAEVMARCAATPKFGIAFENWGRLYDQFVHHFFPPRDFFAYHISARKLVELLSEFVVATPIHKKVVEIVHDGRSADIQFDDHDHINVDFVIDARGFPRELGADHLELKWIPTNAAIIRQGPLKEDGEIVHRINGETFRYCSLTRSVARRHGWVFVIPLTHRTSYGYIYNRHITAEEEVRADFERFLDEAGAECSPEENHLKFPNFTRRTFFDGTVMHIGNAASFIEPLEATAITIILKQVKAFTHWPLGRLLDPSTRHLPRWQWMTPKNLDVFNTYLLKMTLKISVFVAWHYAKGAPYQSDFWQFATANLAQMSENETLRDIDVMQSFERVAELAVGMPHPFDEHNDFLRFIREDDRADDIRYEMFPAASFAEVGHGIGWYGQVSSYST